MVFDGYCKSRSECARNDAIEIKALRDKDTGEDWFSELWQVLNALEECMFCS